MSKLTNWCFLTLIYASWLLATWFHGIIPFWLLLPIGGTLLAWHGSFQHEAIHDHLASRRWLNDLTVCLPLNLWLPFPLYRRTHRAHHDFEALTNPYRDPESFYMDQVSWRRLPPIAKWALIWHHTVPGRLILGPFLTIGQFFFSEARALSRGDQRNLSVWLWHLVGVAIVLIWVMGVCSMTFLSYLFYFVLPGTCLTLLRSFAEHKAAHTSFERTAIVEAGWFFSVLFLNNNLHFAHHRRPDLPWQDLPKYYRTHRHDLLQENGHLCYRGGYKEVVSRFLVRPVDRPVHPYI